MRGAFPLLLVVSDAESIGALLDGAGIGPKKRTQRGPHFHGSDNESGV